MGEGKWQNLICWMSCHMQQMYGLIKVLSGHQCQYRFDCVYVCVYQWDSSWLQAWCRGSGVHVVKQTVYLPQRNSSSFVTDLKTDFEVMGRKSDTDSINKKVFFLKTQKYILVFI